MAEFMPPDGDRSSLLIQADLGRVPKVSETTEVKGQFGLDQSGGTGKTLKLYFFTEMSYSKYQQTYLGPKGIEQQILNSIFTTHDIGCGCPDPPTHILKLIAPLVKKKNLSSEEKKKLNNALVLSSKKKKLLPKI